MARAAAKELGRPGFVANVSALGEELPAGLTQAATDVGVKEFGRGVGPLLLVMFADREAHNCGELVRKIDDAAYRRFWASTFNRGISIRSHSSAGSVSRAHGAAEVKRRWRRPEWHSRRSRQRQTSWRHLSASRQDAVASRFIQEERL